MAKDPVEQVLKTARSYELIAPGDRVMLAVSGGPDSMFMMHALTRFKKKLSIKELSVCNLDHGLRGGESARDSEFVKDACRRYGLKCLHRKISLKLAAKNGLSTEEAAREARYRFFSDSAKAAGADIVATGHTLDDQAETVLMRIIKGSSLKGLAGISPRRREKEIFFVRPLIELEKSEIVRYLDGAGVPYRTDRTNLEPVFFRNVVRGEIIPFLERYNPRLKRALFSLAEHIREDYEFIDSSRAALGRSIIGKSGPCVDIRLKDLVMQPRALQKEILRDSLEKAGGLVKKLSFRHWKEIEALLRQKGKGSSVDLPGDIRVTRHESNLVFGRR